MYIALETMRVGKPDGTVEVRYYGDPVPEAAGWDHAIRHSYLSERRLGLAHVAAPPTTKATESHKKNG